MYTRRGETERDRREAKPAATARVRAQPEDERRRTGSECRGDEARELRRTPLAEESRPAAAKPVERKPEFREVTLPSGTALSVELATTVGSDTSHVEDPCPGNAAKRRRVDGVEALPVGTAVLGHVTSAVPRRQGQGRRVDRVSLPHLDLPGEGGPGERQHRDVLARVEATKKKDATKIGVGAGAGAVIGGIVGGGGGAAKGARSAAAQARR